VMSKLRVVQAFADASRGAGVVRDLAQARI
jgi:hypothetical protein